MVVIQKKRILILVSIVLITLFIANISENTIATVAIPVTNKVIVVDARTW